jgi:hypothetical protein
MDSSQANRGTMWATRRLAGFRVLGDKSTANYPVSSGLAKHESVHLLVRVDRLMMRVKLFLDTRHQASLEKITTGGLRT